MHKEDSVGKRNPKGSRTLERSPAHSDVAYSPMQARFSWFSALLQSPLFYFGLVGLLVALILTGFFLYGCGSPLNMDNLEVGKCPACFGQSYCPIFFRGDVQLFRFYGSRQVRTGDLEETDFIVAKLASYQSDPIVLRRLFYPGSSDAVDAAVCRRGLRDGFPSESPPEAIRHLKCIPNLSIWRLRGTSGPETGTPLLAHHLSAKSLSKNIEGENNNGYAPFVRCATPRLLNLIMKRFRERNSFNALTQWLRFDELILLFNLVVNPHSVISQTFPASAGWPVPDYLGACGRLTVEKPAGTQLADFCPASMTERLRALKGLLQLPTRLVSYGSKQLSENPRLDSNFSLFLGNFDWDSFAVDPKSYSVTVIEARHLIAVDMEGKSGREDFAYSVNASELDTVVAGMKSHGCRGNTSITGDAGGPVPPCISAEHAEALCREPFSSDHNYWAVCVSAVHGGLDRLRASQSLLPCTNFLQGMPPELIDILNNCLHDSKPGARKAHVLAALEVIDLSLNFA